MGRRRYPNYDIDFVIKVIGLGLVILAAVWLLEAIIAVLTSPLFWIAAIALGVVVAVRWKRR